MEIDVQFILKLMDYANDNISKVLECNHASIHIKFSDDLVVGIDTQPYNDDDKIVIHFISPGKQFTYTYSTSEWIKVDEKFKNLINYKLEVIRESVIKYKIDCIINLMTPVEHRVIKNIEDFNYDE